MGKQANGKHVILVAQDKHIQYTKASKAVERAVTKTRGFKKMKPTEMMSVINAALRDCFEVKDERQIQTKNS